MHAAEEERRKKKGRDEETRRDMISSGQVESTYKYQYPGTGTGTSTKVPSAKYRKVPYRHTGVRVRTGYPLLGLMRPEALRH